MNKILLATAGMAALAIAAPASAQSGNVIQNGIASILGGGSRIDARLSNLNLSIQNSYQRGDISQRQAVQLQGDVTNLSRRERSYRAGGLSRDERNDLEQRMQVLEGRVQQAGYDRDDRYSNDDRYGNDDRYSNDDRDDRYGRDDRWSDNDQRYGGRDGCPPGLARKNNGCLPPGQAMRIGERYSNQYQQVPASYGERYRDTTRYLYRYNDGRIYQIERRTGVVVSVTAARR
jgi:hypothetical protein